MGRERAELFRLIELGKFEAYTTSEILMEIENVLKRPKFQELIRINNLDFDEIIQKVISLSKIIITAQTKERICRDKDDDKFLVCAYSASANFIITGDEDLLLLKEFKGILIISAGKFLQLHSPK